MKRLKINLAIVAVILGTSMAFATSENVMVAAFYNDAPIGQPTHWVPIPSGKTVSCNEDVRDCTADASMNVLETGTATLIDL